MIRLLPALLCLSVVATPVAAQARPLQREFGVLALSTLDDPAYLAGGLYGALRPGGNLRLAVTAVLGAADGTTLARGELLAHFVLNPNRTRGIGAYGLGGLAAVTGHGTRGYLVLGAGLEAASGRRSGWAVEGGVGGGVRLTAGWRWRW